MKFLIALAALAASTAAAADDECEPPSVSGDGIVVGGCVLRRDIVVTASRAKQAPEKTGRAVTLITSDDLERLQLQSVADILATTPGVTATRNGGAGGFSAVRIRGAEGEQTLTLIDGVRVNDPSSPGGGFDFGNLLVGNIERIEVLRGPNSVPWGSQAIGGVVNIVTTPIPNDFGGSARAEYGYKNAASLVANAGGRFGIVSAAIGGGYFRDDGVSAFKRGAERDGYRQYAANGKIGVALSDELTIDLRAYYADSRTQIDGSPPPFFAFTDTPQYSKAKEFYGYVGANLRLGALANRVAFTIADINRDNFASPAAAAPSFLARGRTERLEYQGDYTLSDSIRAIFGGEHESSRFTDGFSPAKTHVTSGYAQLVFDPLNRLTLTAGTRIDDHRDYGTQTTLSANLVWRPRGGPIVRAAYGEGFKAPTLFQLFSFFGNPALDPERAQSYELGIEQNLIGRTLTIGVTAFQRDTTGQIDFISCFGQTGGICTDRPFGTYDNIDRSRARGVETFVKLRPSDRLTVDANYSHIKATDRDTGLALLRRPRHSVNFDLDWQARDWLRVGGALKLVSDSADVDFQTFARTRLDGYALASLRAAVPLGDRIEFYGRIENLFDARYETVSGYGTYGRNAHVGVRAKF